MFLEFSCLLQHVLGDLYLPVVWLPDEGIASDGNFGALALVARACSEVVALLFAIVVDVGSEWL